MVPISTFRPLSMTLILEQHTGLGFSRQIVSYWFIFEPITLIIIYIEIHRRMTVTDTKCNNFNLKI